MPQIPDPRSVSLPYVGWTVNRTTSHRCRTSTATTSPSHLLPGRHWRTSPRETIHLRTRLRPASSSLPASSASRFAICPPTAQLMLRLSSIYRPEPPSTAIGNSAPNLRTPSPTGTNSSPTGPPERRSRAMSSTYGSWMACAETMTSRPMASSWIPERPHPSRSHLAFNRRPTAVPACAARPRE